MEKQKIFVIGTGGLLGNKLVNSLYENFDICGSYNKRYSEDSIIGQFKMDITNFDDVKKMITKNKPDIIINTAALHNVDFCEKNQELAKLVNIDAVNNLNNVANSIDAKLIHVSTDSIFDGTKKNPYIENDTPKPVNYYGYSKLEGEKIILQNSNNIVVRASILYGWLPFPLASMDSSSMKSTNFAQWLINMIDSEKQVKIITDEFSSPIIAEEFARGIIHLILKKLSGVFHIAPPININRYEFSVKLINYLEMNSKLVLPINSKELGRDVSTGSNKSLNSEKIQKTGFEFKSLENSFEIIKDQRK